MLYALIIPIQKLISVGQKNKIHKEIFKIRKTYFQTNILISGLCFDKGISFTSRFFRTRVMQFLGRISMAIYLVHEPLREWMKVIINGGYKEWKDGKKPGIVFPPWAIPIHSIISIFVAMLLTLYVEEPARRYFKKKIERSSTYEETEMTEKA